IGDDAGDDFDRIHRPPPADRQPFLPTLSQEQLQLRPTLPRRFVVAAGAVPTGVGVLAGSGKLPMAVLVLFAAAAGARIIATDLGHAVGGVAVVLVVGLGRFFVGPVAAAVGVLELQLAGLGF